MRNILCFVLAAIIGCAAASEIVTFQETLCVGDTLYIATSGVAPIASVYIEKIDPNGYGYSSTYLYQTVFPDIYGTVSIVIPEKMYRDGGKGLIASNPNSNEDVVIGGDDRFTSTQPGAYRLYVYDIYEVSNFVEFTVVSPTITLISPNSGEEVWKIGDSHRIKWKQDGVKFVSIYATKRGKLDDIVYTVAENVPANEAYYWYISDDYTVGTYQISIVDSINGAGETGDTFQVEAAPISTFTPGYMQLIVSQNGRSVTPTYTIGGDTGFRLGVGDAASQKRVSDIYKLFSKSVLMYQKELNKLQKQNPKE